MRPLGWTKNFLPLLALFAFSIAFRAAEGQSPAASTRCGEAKVHIDNPVYLTISGVVVAVEPPPGWALDPDRKNPFFFLKLGEKYESARTLMYVRIEQLDGPFQSALQRDEHVFTESCQPSKIEEPAQPEILEQGCEKKTQLFVCGRKQGFQVDLDTKISIHGLLLNVVLSSDSVEEISRYKKDYEFTLKHLGLVGISAR